MTSLTLERALWIAGAWICAAVGVAALAWAMDFNIVTNPAWLKGWVAVMGWVTAAPSAIFCLYRAFKGFNP
jgi:hypothetical protein